MTSLPDGWGTAHGRATSLPLPEDWQVVPAAGADLAVAHPQLPAHVFRPNVVVRELPYAGSLPALAAFALATSKATLTNARFVANDETSIAGVEARRQRFTYDGGGHNVVVDRYLAVRGGRALEITGSCGLDTSFDMLGAFAIMAGEVQWRTPQADAGAVPAGLDAAAPGAPEASAPAAQDGAGAASAAPPTDAAGGDGRPPVLAGTREPRHDAFASGLAGHPLEDLSRLAATQPYPSEGPLLSPETVEFLQQQASRHKLGRFDMMQNSTAIQELLGSGLLHPDGTFAPGLEVMLAPWRSPEVTVRIGAHHAGRDTTLTIHAGGGRAIVLAGPSAPELVHGSAPHGTTPDGKVRVDLVATTGVPAAIAAWVGLGPAWTVAGNVVRVEGDTFARRVAGAAPAPEGADAASLRFWNEPWFAWSMVIDDSPFQRSWLNAGSAGHYLVGLEDDGSLGLEPMPSVQVWDVLVQEFGVALTHVKAG